ncbi:MAG: hemolysin III family protein [bacterium]
MTNQSTFRTWKDPASAVSHFVGFLAAVVGMAVLVAQSPGPALKTASFAIYGISLSLLFLASASYHFFDLGVERNLWLRRLDHSAIYLLIAGTYVPPVAHFLVGTWRTGMLISLAVTVALGIAFKLSWFHMPRWVNAGMYLMLGWMVLIPGERLLGPMPDVTLGCLYLGGAFYTVGAVVYATKWPDPWPDRFGFHDIWHVFVLGGAAAHFALVYTLLPIPLAQ